MPFQERDFWTVSSDPVHGLVISKPFDDGSTFNLSDTTSRAGVVSSFAFEGDYRIELNYDWYLGVTTPDFGGGYNEVILRIESADNPNDVPALLRNLRQWTGSQRASFGHGLVFDSSLAGQLILEKSGNTVSVWATDAGGSLALLGTRDASAWPSQVRVRLLGKQWQLISSNDFQQVDPRGPMTVSIGSVSITASSIIHSEIEVSLDIKFCSDPNVFDCKKKDALPVTIFGMDSFDVADIDPSTLQLCLEDLSDCTSGPSYWSLIDRGNPDSDLGAAMCAIDPLKGGELDHLNLDGFLDLDAAFEAQEVQDMLGIYCGLKKNAFSEALIITGSTFDGTPIFSIPLPNAGVDQLVRKKPDDRP